MEVYLGPAGIPLIAKGKSTVEALKEIANLELNAFECEFVRNIYLKPKDAEEVGKIAKELGIKVSVHAPYFLNLCSEKERVIENSKKRILISLDRAERMNAECLVIHAGYYGRLTKEQAFEKIKQGIEDILSRFEGKTKIAIETMAKESQFGSLEEVIKLCKELGSKVIPLIDFAHIYVRNNGFINYSEIFDKLEVLKLKHINSHFSGVKYNLNTKKFVDVHVPIYRHPPFEPLAKEIVKRDLSITIICESPNLEKDALKMKRIFEKLTKDF